MAEAAECGFPAVVLVAEAGPAEAGVASAVVKVEAVAPAEAGKMAYCFIHLKLYVVAPDPILR